MYRLGASARDSTIGCKLPGRTDWGQILLGHHPQGVKTGGRQPQETLTGVPEMDSPVVLLPGVPLTQAFRLQLTESTPNLSHLLWPTDGQEHSQASLVTS